MGYKLEMIQMILKRPSTHFRKHIKKEKIDHLTIQYAQIDNEVPTVIFENGMGAGMKFWDEVFLEIGKTNTMFTYNRNDKKDAENKRISTDRVELLRKLLLKRGLKPPYILVGHSHSITDTTETSIMGERKIFSMSLFAMSVGVYYVGAVIYLLYFFYLQKPHTILFHTKQED